ncbi:MAG: hypothetical protein Pg6A_14230 [Termitinemataceae bacterium]|nr:MAG: hypothetical protein Pg6A_14230 [Termitinemataceae bacterium]
MNYFTRVIGAVILVVFSWSTLSCGYQADNPEIKQKTEIIPVPGEGTPRYLYIDEQGNVSETDVGLTGFFIEDNKNAEGVVIVSDTRGTAENVVSVYNPQNQSTVFIYYKKNKDFPYRMKIESATEKYLAWLSQYREDEQHYDITFQHEGVFDTESDIVLNSAFLSLYQNAPDLNSDQNLRLKLIHNSLAIWGSLAATFDLKQKGPTVNLSNGRNFVALNWFSDLCRGVASFFKAVPIVAAVVSVIPVGLSVFIAPVALVVATVVKTALIVSLLSLSVAAGFDAWADSADKQNGGDSVPSVLPVTVKVNDRYIANGEEFHIGLNSGVLFEFTVKGRDTSSIVTIDNIMLPPYDPGISPPATNAVFFSKTLEKNGAADQFQVRINRIIYGVAGSGKVSFAFSVNGDSPISVNDDNNGFVYKQTNDNEEKIYKNLVVLRFCIDQSCPDYVP